MPTCLHCSSNPDICGMFLCCFLDMQQHDGDLERLLEGLDPREHSGAASEAEGVASSEMARSAGDGTSTSLYSVDNATGTQHGQYKDTHIARTSLIGLRYIHYIGNFVTLLICSLAGQTLYMEGKGLEPTGSVSRLFLGRLRECLNHIMGEGLWTYLSGIAISYSLNSFYRNSQEEVLLKVQCSNQFDDSLCTAD